MSVRNTGGKSNYSVDEMVDRLKEAQARKEGRSRRRRSRQPRVQQRRKLVWAAVGACGLTLLGIIALIAFFVLSKLRYESEAFRGEVSGRVSEILGMKAEFDPFEVSGTTIASGRIRATAAGSGGIIREVDASALQGKLAIGSFLGDDWRIDPLRIYRMSVVFALPDASSGSSAKAAVGEVLSTLTGGFGLASRPDSIALASVQVREIDLHFGGPRSDTALVGATGNAEVFGDGMSFQGGGGELRWGRLPAMKLASLLGKLDGDRLEITKARLAMGDEGEDEILVSGMVDVRADGGYQLDVAMDNIEIDRLLGEAWWKRIEGVVDAEFAMSREFGTSAGRQIDGRIHMNGFLLKDLPLLDTLAVFTAEPGFAFIDLPIVSAVIRTRGDVLEITDFEAQRSGLLRLSGTIEVARDGGLGGVIELGVPTASFDRIRTGLPSFFEDRGNGFAWTEVRLSGTIDEPREDLGDKLRELIRIQRSQNQPPATPAPAPSSPDAAPGTTLVDPVPAAPVLPPGDLPTEAPSPEDARLEEAFEKLIE